MLFYNTNYLSGSFYLFLCIHLPLDLFTSPPPPSHITYSLMLVYLVIKKELDGSKSMLISINFNEREEK